MRLVALVSLLLISPVLARDPGGKYAQQDPKMHEWFEGLKSGKGPCCSDADGNVVKDADWESVDDSAKPTTHYRVRLPKTPNQIYHQDTQSYTPDPETEWVDVPDDAVIRQPNLYGRTMVWPMYGYMGVSVRCFILGPLT